MQFNVILKTSFHYAQAFFPDMVVSRTLALAGGTVAGVHLLVGLPLGGS